MGEEASRGGRSTDRLPSAVHTPHPPLSVVRRFAHLLDQSQQDYVAEAELLTLQDAVVRQIRANQQLEQDLNALDIKIGLLVKNRITLQVGPLLLGAAAGDAQAGSPGSNSLDWVAWLGPCPRAPLGACVVVSGTLDAWPRPLAGRGCGLLCDLSQC